MSFNLAEDKDAAATRRQLAAPKTEDDQKEIVGWASTERGGKFPIFEGEDKKQALDRHLLSVQGKKGKVVQEHEAPDVKKIQKRFGIAKTTFKIRDEVIFDDFTKTGIVYGFSGDSLSILAKDGRRYSKEKTLVFKTSELIGNLHWDAMTLNDRVVALNKAGISDSYLNSSWFYIPFPARNKIQKAMGPAGYEGGGVNTSTSGVFNPVHQDKTVSDKLEEEEKKPHKNPTIADESKEKEEAQSNLGSGKQEPKHYTITEVQPEPQSPKPTQQEKPSKEKTQMVD